VTLSPLVGGQQENATSFITTPPHACLCRWSTWAWLNKKAKQRPSVFWVVNTAYVCGWLQTFRDSLFVPSSTAKSKTLEEGADYPETSVTD